MHYARAAVLVVLVLSGCDGQPPPIPLDGGRRDAGPDAAARDAGRDARVPDDSGQIDPPDAGPLRCTASPDDVYKIATDTAGDRAVALAAAGNGFGLLYTALPDGGVISRVHAIGLSSSGTLGTPHALSTGGVPRRPVSLAAAGTSWIAAWVDNDPTRFEVRTLALGADLAPAAGATAAHLTSTDAGEDNPVLFMGGGGALLAWVEEDTAAGGRLVRAQRVSLDGAPAGEAATASTAGHRPGALVLAELAAGPVLLYTSAIDGPAGPETRLFMQDLTSAGAMRGAARPIDEEANADGTLDAFLTSSGGAVVFGALVGGVRSEVRFRAFDAAGAPLGDERILAQGTDASIAAFAGGYAVSYRAAASGEAPAEVRLLLVSELGDLITDVTVAQAMLEGGRTTVRVSGDGQIAIGWADSTPSQTDVRLARVACGAGS